MLRSKERTPYSLPRYRNVRMDHVLALLTDGSEDYYLEFRNRTRRRPR